MERESRRDRQAAGIAAAKASGQYWGERKPGKSKGSPAKARQLAAKGPNNTEIAKLLGVGRWTVIRALKNHQPT